ncbi:MAG: phage major capsid protein [Candidatus Heimdallarchaeaceae archaeon]
MADRVEMAEIRGLDVDKAVKGFALTNYIFKNHVTVSSMSGDSVRWYQETADDLTATAPSKVADIAPLATFTNLEPSWTRQTSYPKKYGARGFISLEDLKSADIDILARTLLRLTRGVIKQVDSRIYNIIKGVTLTGAALGTGWDDTTNGKPLVDILSGQQAIAEHDYDISSGEIWMTPKNHRDLKQYLIDTKGTYFTQYASEKLKTGVVMNVLGWDVVVSNNVTADEVWMGLPKVACTWKTYTDTTANVTDKPGLGKEIVVWEMGEAILTDPYAGYLITDVDT